MTIVQRLLSWLESSHPQATHLSKKQAADLLKLTLIYEKKQLERAFIEGYLGQWDNFEDFYAAISKEKKKIGRAHV